MDKRASCVGQLYRGEPQTKSWSLIVSGQVSIHLMEGEGRAGDWKLAAFKKDKVWECRLDPRIKFRVKNDFVQWQMKGGGGEPVMYGIRLKDSEVAAQLSDRITEVLNAMMSKPPEEGEVQLRVLFSSREPTLLTVRNSTTMIQILRMFCQKRQLDNTQFIIALPPDSSHPPLKPSTMVASLKTKEVQVVKKGSRAPPTSSAPLLPPGSAAPTEATDSNGLAANEQLVQVELPHDQRTVVRVSPQTTISQLLRYICEKRNMELADHRFDLPATEESLAGKTLEQLKITAIRVVMREEAKRRLEQLQAAGQEEQSGGGGGSPEVESKSPSRTKRKSTKRNKIETNSGESPKANRRQAPPPPPPLQSRRTQPNLIKELAVAAEKKATLRRMGQSSDYEETPPETRSAARTVNGAYHSADQDKDSECSTEESPEQERKTKVPLLPSTSRTALLPRSYPPPPLPTSKATPTSETAPEASIKAVDSEVPHKTVGPPPVAEKPKKKKMTSLEDFDEPDSAHQAPPTNPEEEVDYPAGGVPVVDMDTLIEEAATTETTVKKTKKKVKRKHGSEDTAGAGQKEKKTKSGKSTKKKKKVSQQDSGELRQEGSLDKEDPPQHQDNLDQHLAPAALPQEDIQLPPERQTESQQLERQPDPQFEHPAMSSLKQLSPDTKQRNTASLRRRPRGPAPLPPPPGSKTMTLGRIRPGEQRDVAVKQGRGFTVGAEGRPVSDEITTKQRSASDALPPSEKVENGGTSSVTPVGTRHRPTRKAPSRPAPTTPQNKEKVGVDEGKTEMMRPRSLSGSPRRPPPNVPTAAAQSVPHPTADSRDADTRQTEENHVNVSGEVEEGSSEVLARDHEAAVGKEMEGDESLQQTAVSSKPPSTPPKPKNQQRWSPGQSPSGRRREAATVICKDTEDGGKEVIVKPSPHSKRKFTGPLIFKMPPPPSAPPTKSKAKKPPPPTLAKPGKRDGTGSSETEIQDIYTESADSSVCESISETPGELASSVVASSPPKSLSDTLVSNEFTNLDELLSDSQQDNIATTDFSIEENLEPIDEYNGLEWNESGLADSDSIPYQDPGLELAAALNFNSNNNNSLEADVDYNYGGFPPPPEIPPPLATRSAEDSDEWERDSNKTGELNFDSNSSTAELSKQSVEDGVVVLEEEVGPGGVVLLNVKRMDDDNDVPVLPDKSEQDAQTATSVEENAHLPPPTSIPRDPSIGTQLDELDDVVSSLAELAAEVPSVPPPPPPPLFTPSQPHPITSSTPTHGEEHRPSSPEPPPIPLTLPPSLSDDDENDDDFPLGPPPPLVTSEPPSLTPSPPDSPTTNSRASEVASLSQGRRGDSDKQQQSEENKDNEVLNRLKQRQVKGSSSWRRRRGSRDQEVLDDGESELLEKLKQRQAKYRQKARARQEDTETSPTTERPVPSDSGLHSIPPQQPGVGTGTGGDNVQLQLQFLQQQVLQQQMMQLQQQFHQLHSYAMQQGVSMPTNVMVPGVGGAMMNQQAAFMTTPMAVAPPTGVVPQPQQIMMQTSAGQVLVPAASMPQMMPNPQGTAMMSQGQLPGQGFAPNASLPTQQQQQMVYGQGISQPQTQPPLMSTTVATEQPVMYGQGVSRAPLPPPLPQTQPPVMSISAAMDKTPHSPSEDLSNKAQDSSEKAPLNSTTTSTGVAVTPARMSHKRRLEDVRTLVLGPLEEQFDSLMDQVRDADPTAVLKKIPEDVEEKEPSSSYTGMAAALAEALKQRRLHVADKRRSLGELDESNSEWQSP